METERGLKFFLGALLVSGLFMAETKAQRVHWPASQGGNGHWYEAVNAPTGIDWLAADSAATGMGGHLASIENAAENDFVFNLVDDPRYWFLLFGRLNGPWLGGMQPAGSPEPAGGWTWVTGEAFGFTAWFPGEPNNLASACSNENAIHFHADGAARDSTWNDTPRDSCGGALGFVVEYELTLETPHPGQAGQPNEFVVRWASPNERVFFAYGLQVGSTSVPGCAIGLAIDSAVLFGIDIANAGGTARVLQAVPAKAAGRTILLQAYESASCRASNRVSHTFN